MRPPIEIGERDRTPAREPSGRPPLAPPVLDLAAPPAVGGTGAGDDRTPLQVALRRKWLIMAFAIVVASCVYVALQFVTPSYVAEAAVRIDIPQVRVLDSNTSFVPEMTPSLELVRTEMAELNSVSLAAEAVDKMGLATLRAFQLCPKVSSFERLRLTLERVRGHLPPPPPPCTPSAEVAVKVLLSSLAFTTDRSSYVITIAASWSDPATAARLANGYAQAYVTFVGETKNRLAKSADDWLSADLTAMQQKMLASDAAVEAYRQKAHLIGVHGETGAGPSGSGVDTVASQQLGQLNNSLGSATATYTEKAAQLASIREALKQGNVEAIAPVLSSPVVQSLVTHHGELAANLETLRATYGASYPAVRSAAAALARNEQLIRAEAIKVVKSLESEVAGLAASKTATAGEVAGLERRVAGESEDDVKLQELEREAQTNRTIYESLFVRLKQAEAERRIQQASAAVAVEALPPDFPTFPRKRMMVAGAFLASLGIGVGLAFAAEMMSRRFRDATHIEDELGLPVIGMFARRGRAPHDVVVDAPMSLEAEAVHAILTQVAGRGAEPRAGGIGVAVLVTSALPGEGKSSFSVALGRSAIRSGLSAFILDCDLRRPTIGRLLATGRRNVMAPIDTQAADQAQVISDLMGRAGVDERSGLRYLSLGEFVTNPHGLLAWPSLGATIKLLRTRFDVVILDTPPVLAAADVLKVAGFADQILLMIDWLGTPRQAVAAATRALRRAHVTIAGAVMTKVDLRKYARASTRDQMYLRHYAAYHGPADVDSARAG